jgi:hypothetical protein
MPRDPPVTSATRPFSENRSLNMRSSLAFADGFERGGSMSQGRGFISALILRSGVFAASRRMGVAAHPSRRAQECAPQDEGGASVN